MQGLIERNDDAMDKEGVKQKRYGREGAERCPHPAAKAAAEIHLFSQRTFFYGNARALDQKI